MLLSGTGWTLREQLLLMQAVYRHGTDDWPHISRVLRPLRAPSRPAHFFSTHVYCNTSLFCGLVAACTNVLFPRTCRAALISISICWRASLTMTRCGKRKSSRKVGCYATPHYMKQHCTEGTRMITVGPEPVVVELARRLYHARVRELKEALQRDRQVHKYVSLYSVRDKTKLW